MTIRGRPPKPTALKVLNGNPGKRPLNKFEPKPKPILPKCPAWLDPAAKKEWRRVVPELERIGMLTCVDGAALGGYCQSYGRWVAAEQFIQKHGMVLKHHRDICSRCPRFPSRKNTCSWLKGFAVNLA
jgi:P27 family predicted phage terminase small subunit